MSGRAGLRAHREAAQHDPIYQARPARHECYSVRLVSWPGPLSCQAWPVLHPYMNTQFFRPIKSFTIDSSPFIDCMHVEMHACRDANEYGCPTFYTNLNLKEWIYLILNEYGFGY